MEVWQNMFTVIYQLGVLLEAFCQSLRDCRGHSNVLRLREKSSSPDLVSFFEWFMGEHFGFEVGRLWQFQSRFILVFISILHKGRKWTSSAGVYLSGILFSQIPLLLAFSLATRAAAQEALGHFDHLCYEFSMTLAPLHLT